ncbi:ribonuclease R [Catenovulum agarivorans DS-2]|uniref:Ribonuclease R n=1 Tax=Catenovulum agarivorans DS-2 TaxID=1328313 RepID=W7QR15_9ALTE|nr:ribonuclease R [Catenovulum agarivorans]EWH10318.1 ribonuclease R [Catenovulum agarivorans DS-2]
MNSPLTTQQLNYHPLLAEKVSQFVSEQTQPISYLELCNQFNIADKDAQHELTACLKALEAEGRVIIDKQQNYATPEVLGLVVGKVVGHKDGFGFVTLPRGQKDLYLSQSQMATVLHGDLVLAKALGSDNRGRKEGRVVRVLQPRNESIVGRIFIEHGIAYVMPDDGRISQEIIVANEHKNGARSGQMVVVTLLTRPNKKMNATGKISEILGEHMAPGMEIEIALRKYEIPHEWPKAVTKAAQRVPEFVSDKDKQDRVDLRDLPLVTIDGEDARDFDDAVYCERKKSGGWRLWVAIADVSFYVRSNTALDAEAQLRGTSVYFPDQVVPMLPEQLSNGLCSLNPQVDRLCMVCEMTVSEQGRLSGYKFYQAVMNSHARLTYNKVSQILQGDERLIERYQTLVPHLQELHLMYKALKGARHQRGAIEFETAEAKFIFNAQRKIDSIELVVRNDAHKIIEECMIQANVAAARFIAKHNGNALYRVHDAPDGEKLTQFVQFLAELGIESQFFAGEIKPIHFKQLVERIQGRPDQELIQTMLLRSMKQAVYSPDNNGHFGLALPAYAHFTSPIRRYPDLVVHRTIKAILLEQKLMQGHSGEHVYSEAEAENLGINTSMAERRADEATRDVAGWLKCEFMQDHVGDVFNGVISAVTSFGFFVRLDDIHVEGLVHVANLENDFYIYDNAKQRLIGEQKRKVYKLGDEVTIQVLSANLDERKIDFVLYQNDTDKHQKSQTNRKKSSGSKTQQLMQNDDKYQKQPSDKKSKGAGKRSAKAGKKSGGKKSSATSKKHAKKTSRKSAKKRR